MSGAFLAELDAQRSAALLELQAAQAAADDSLATAALARLRDLDELLNRNAVDDIDLAAVELATLPRVC